jgi:ubiquinone/menaquinone biosynthesis C-methylase UbiE
MSLAPRVSLLSRVLEPEAMDSRADACDYDSMDHREVNRVFVADLLVALGATDLPKDVQILDIGTGTAQIPIELCRQNPVAKVVAIDLAAHMLELASANVAAAGLSGSISLKRVDAKRLPFEDQSFAAVMSNSIIHHIPEPRAALAEALRVLRPCGLAFVRDLARPHDDSQVAHLVDTYAAGCNAHQRQLFEDSLRAALSIEEVRELVSSLGCEGADVQPTSDRHWTWRVSGK